jgi:hypothetical protein
VLTDIEIERPADVVGTYAADPSTAAEWYDSIDSLAWKSERQLRLGSLIEFPARFLGRELIYTYEVVEHDHAGRLAMRTSEGPVLMETTYTWRPITGGSPEMTLRNRGMPSGFRR